MDKNKTANNKNSTNTKSKKSIQKRSNSQKYIISSLIILVFFIIYYFFSNRSGNITGHIVDSSTGSSVTGVKITLDNKQDFENNNVTGSFIIQNVKPGEHTLTFNKDGFNSYTEKISIKAGQHFDKKINLTLNIQKSDNIALTLLVANSGSTNISFIDVKSHSRKNIEVGSKPYDVLPLIENGKIYTANFGEGSVSVIDVQALREIKKIQLESNISSPSKLSINSNKDKLYVINSSLAFISVIDLNNDELVAPGINLERPAINMINDTSGGNIILLHSDGISLLSESGNLTQFFKVDNIRGDKIAFSDSRKEVYISGRYNLIKVNILTGEIKNYPLSMSPSELVLKDNILYILFSESLSLFDINQERIIKENIMTGGQVVSSAKLLPDKKLLYITNLNSDNISVFDCENQVMLPDVFLAGNRPKSIDFMGF